MEYYYIMKWGWVKRARRYQLPKIINAEYQPTIKL